MWIWIWIKKSIILAIYLHVLRDNKDWPILRAHPVQLDKVVVLQLGHNLGLLDEVILGHGALLHHFHGDVNRS